MKRILDYIIKSLIPTTQPAAWSISFQDVFHALSNTQSNFVHVTNDDKIQLQSPRIVMSHVNQLQTLGLGMLK